MTIRHGALTINTTCKSCHGIGKEIGEKCFVCSGSGKNKEERKIELDIPEGIGMGHIIRVPSEKLDVIVDYKRHKELYVNNIDTNSDKFIDIYTAILGGSIKVYTLSGEKVIKIKPYSQPNTILRIKKAGMKNRNGFIGDHLVHLNIKMPEKLNDEQKKMIEKMKEMEEK
jgi:molecular chaperone DnaJ